MAAVLITGATGKQGGAVIKALIRRNATFQILAVTRDAKSASAQRLLQQSENIQLVEGNLDDPKEISKRARSQISVPLWGVFSVQATGTGAAEERQGKGLIDESLKNGIKHFVYTSADRGGEASSNNPTQIPHFAHKHNVEQYLMTVTKDGAMDWTILRPTAFFDNLNPGFSGKIFNTAWKLSLKGKPIQFISTSDVGVFGAAALLEPDVYKGKALSLAGDELTFDEMARICEHKTGKKVPTTYDLPCYVLLALVKDLRDMFRWFRDEGFGADIEAVRRLQPEIKDFGSWLETESQHMSHE